MSSARTVDGRAGGSTDEWGTPQKFYDLLDEEFGFSLDPCAADEKIAKCPEYIPPEFDGLKAEWGDHKCFVNFPYSRAKEWAAKIVDQFHKGALVVVLCAARTDTAWFHLLARHASEIRFIRGRLSFVGPSGKATGAPFPSAVFVFNHEDDGMDLRVKFWEVPREVRR